MPAAMGVVAFTGLLVAFLAAVMVTGPYRERALRKRMKESGVVQKVKRVEEPCCRIMEEPCCGIMKEWKRKAIAEGLAFAAHQGWQEGF